MSTSTVQPADQGVAQHYPVVHPVTLPRVLHSEWIKLRSLRSTKITLAVAILLMAGVGVLTAAITANQWSRLTAANRASFDPVSIVLGGHTFAQLAIGVLGVLMVSGEYSTGMIRATLTAVPKRLPVLTAKAGVFAAVTLVAMTAASFVAFVCGKALLSSHMQVSLASAGVARAVIGAALYLTLVGLLGVSLGTLLRNTAGAIASLLGVLIFLPLLANLLPSSISNHLTPYLPSNAGGALLNVHQQAGSLAPWAGFAVMCAYAVAALAAAAWVLNRRDA